jgi:hypothetical protein
MGKGREIVTRGVATVSRCQALAIDPAGKRAFSPDDAVAALRTVISKKVSNKSYAAIKRTAGLRSLYLLIYYDRHSQKYSESGRRHHRRDSVRDVFGTNRPSTSRSCRCSPLVMPLQADACTGFKETAVSPSRQASSGRFSYLAEFVNRPVLPDAEFTTDSSRTERYATNLDAAAAIARGGEAPGTLADDLSVIPAATLFRGVLF